MIKENILDKDEFLNKLYQENRFQSFLLFEARIKSVNDYYINGKVNTDLLNIDDRDNYKQYITWDSIKEDFFYLYNKNKDMINGKIILMFNPDNVKKLIEMNNIPVSEKEVGALFLNINIEFKNIYITTGISMNNFSLDKTLENVWDSTVFKYYI